MSHALRVPIVLGGAERVLYYDLNAMCELKQRHGINLLDPGPMDTMDPVVLRALLWAGLLHADPGLTVEQVGGWLDLDSMKPAANAFAEAFGAAAEPMGEQAREMRTDPPAAGDSTGTPSSASATVS